jgi:prephenate dehydratase
LAAVGSNLFDPQRAGTRAGSNNSGGAGADADAGSNNSGGAGARRIAFLGPAGTFAHAALHTLPIAADATLLPLATVTQAIDAVRSGDADGALVPLENSVEGAVPATLDELAGGTPLVIAEETYLPVRFDLLARSGTQLSGVRTVATHPHAEAQTRRWLLANLPAAQLALVGSTAAGAQEVARGEYDAAVAPPVAGELYQLVSLAHDIADNRSAVTRFVLLTRPAEPPPPTGNDRTTLVAYLRADHAGALLEILTEFATRGVNLTRIESRPTKERIGQYCFSIDCEGHVADERVGDALAALKRTCADVRYLGSYPRRDGAIDAIVPGRADADFTDAREWLARLRVTGAS